MTELQVILDFACCRCGHAVGVTLKCAGKGLSAASRTVAAVRVPCPTCHAVNQLYFEPSGTVRDVVPAEATERRLEPSIN
jgi:phage FluMu protein Com